MHLRHCVAEPVVSLKLGAPTGKRVSPLHFAANVPFSQPAFAAGVKRRQDDLQRALQDSGVRAIRFPGGADVYFYLPEGRDLTIRLAHAIGDWSIRDDYEPCSHFVALDEMAAFCRRASVQLIYQLPCLFYLDGETARATIPNDLCKNTPELFDRRRVEEGVAHGMTIVRRLREVDAPVAAWELGNEEFAFCTPEDYTEVALAYIRQIRAIDPETPILVEGMGKHYGSLVPALRGAGLLDSHISFRVHYPFGNWPGPPTKERNGDPAALVAGDVRFDRWLDVFLEGCRGIGLERPSVSVSETTVFKFEEGYWDSYAVVGTHAHALLYAWNWMTLLERPEVDSAVLHDLDSPYFGIMRYDVAFDPATRHFSWLGGETPKQDGGPVFAEQYVVSPTGYANRLLSELAGQELVASGLLPTQGFRVLASAKVVVAVNRAGEAVALEVPFADATGEALTADSLGSCLPGEFRISPLPIEGSGGTVRAAIPPWSVAVIRREPWIEAGVWAAMSAWSSARRRPWRRIAQPAQRR
jgi:hypothetical protein